MKSAVPKTFLTAASIALCLIFTSDASIRAQGTPDPARTQLLNGLRVVHLQKPGDQEVLIKLRIHSGAAFDLAGKEGTLALLGDILFPDPNVREYFTEEMQGRLNIKTDYDAITITMQGRASEFERMIEILRTALVTTQLTPENVDKVRQGRIKILRETSILPAAVADRAIAARLFGDFPYGRPSLGTPESLERVDRADLMLARERFLNPNNATLTIIGGVAQSRAMRALRQLLGIWRKSEQVIPATFRQPAKPDPRTLVINAPGDQSVEIRFAVRGLARRDPDALSASLLAAIAKRRWEASIPELTRSPLFVKHDTFSLPGMLVMGTSIDPLLTGKALTSARDVAKGLASGPVTITELDQARNELIGAINNQIAKSDGVSDGWLDIDTYGVSSTSDSIRQLSNITPADLQRTAGRLFSEGAFASVVVGNSELVKVPLESFGKVELMGAVETKKDGATETSRPKASIGSKPE